MAETRPKEAADELEARISELHVDAGAIAKFLDGLSHEERVAAVRSLGRSSQRALFEAVDGCLPLELVDLVPQSVTDFEVVRHYGRNTLPAFTHFEKRFCRPKGVSTAEPSMLYGFNFQTLAVLTGPGYFVARQDPKRPEIWVDYREVPPVHPDGWPEIRRNEVGLSSFVYGFMVDTLRRVSEHVTIGSAARKGRDIGSWFVLCREQ